MNTRPLRIFLLGTTLSVGAVVGLAPSSDAKPPVAVDPSGPIVVAPPTTVKPPKGLDPCDITACEEPPVLVDDCIRHPRLLCDPPETTPPTTTPPTTRPPERKPPKTRFPSDNPDVVVAPPVFTG
jgi:hypothetical protein